MFKLGLIINPYAGIGGRVGLKGSDGNDIRDKALELGGVKLANQKTENCFKQFTMLSDEVTVYTASGDMGEQLCCDLKLNYQVVFNAAQPSSPIDTKRSFEMLQQQNLDLILFVGGDGTARDIMEVYCDEQAVLGVPAGVKIHSGVYAISAEAAGLLVKEMISGSMLSFIAADVVDLDEQAFRNGRVRSRKFGYLQIPASLRYVQAVKQGNVEVDELVLDDIAAEVIESMQDDCYYVIGSGTSCEAIMKQLKIENTLLGSDIVFNEELYANDVMEKDLLNLLESGVHVQFILTAMGGQGHILGRGNHQISPNVIKMAGWHSFQIIATKSKLNGLGGRPLLVDTGDIELDHKLIGSTKVITGYRDYVLYPVGSIS